jgi:hypothetical protein
MPRKSTIAPVMSRHSATADRPGPASSSPFRSSKPANRIVAARAMITKREAEISALEKALDEADNVKVQRILTTRLLATRNNLRSWLAYLEEDEAPRERRAVIIPPRTR